MKKLFIAASMLVASFAAQAQDYKPVAGDVTAEFGLTGGILFSDLELNNNSGQLRFRYFLADQMAVRVGLGLSAQSEKTVHFGTNDEEGTEVIKSSEHTINLGIEKHFSGSERLSTYAGADLLILKRGASETWTDYDGGGFNSGYSLESKGTNSDGDRSGFGWGLRLVGGADYYFIERVYVGGEFGWGFTSVKNGKYKTTETGQPDDEEASDGSQFEVTPSVVTGIRVGFRF